MPTQASLLTLPLALALLSGAARPAAAQRPVEVAPNAPADQPVAATRECQWAAAERAMAPLVGRARASFPAARRRFEAGLPAGHTFFVTTRLRDRAGRREQVFVAVDSVRGHGKRAVIAGRVWSDVAVVEGYRRGQPVAFPASALVDWMVARPDGSEEGNAVGKFLDTYTPPASCAEA